MKGLTFTFFFLLFTMAGFSQSTYYWVGGTNGLWNDALSWNTNLDGSGTDRSSVNTADVLIFDGSNISGATPSMGTVTPDISGSYTFGQLHLQNSAVLILQRSTTGTASFTIGGDGTALDDLTISSNSTLTVKTSAGGMNLILGVAATSLSTGTVSGILNISDGGSFTSRVTVANPASLFFANGAVLNTNVTVASSYPFGSGTTSPAAASLGIVFQSGSKCAFLGGNSIFANTTGFHPVKFNPGSTLEMNATQPAGLFNGRYLANVVIKSGVAITLTDNFFNIDTLTVNSGGAFNYRTTGTAPISGNIINNGTFGAAAGYSTATLVLDGVVPQTISGSGTFNNFGTLIVGTDANVTLNNNAVISGTSTSSITGRLNAQTYTVSGTGNFQFRPAATANSMATVADGSNVVTLNGAGPYGAANVAIGAKVSGDGIQPDTYIISTNSGSFLFNMSKPAIGNYPAFSGNITITNNPATLETANAAGADGTITTTGTRTFGTGTHYIFNAPTAAPFTASSANAAGNVTFNASATTNKTSQSIGGTLTLNSGILTIRNTDLLRITSGNAIGGAPFSSSKYIVSEVSGNNLGVLRIDNLPVTTTLFPVGTVNYYLPVSLTPASVCDHAVSVFEGITEEGTPAGTPFGAARKANVVDAVWIIDRPTGSGDCIMELQWNAALEGANFTGYANTQIGIGRHDGTNWGVDLGTGDNALNTATALYSNFSPFGVGYNGAILAAGLKNISASIRSNAVEISWEVANEAGTVRYEIEKSVNKTEFNKTGSVDAAGKNKYEFTDVAYTGGIVYYRLKIISTNGQVKYSDIVIVKKNSANAITLYPNPVVNSVTLSGLSQGSVYRIINSTGQRLMQQKTNANTLSIDLSALRSGLYFIEIVSADNTTIRQSFIKQ